mgnify:CR=1 FL=1
MMTDGNKNDSNKENEMNNGFTSKQNENGTYSIYYNNALVAIVPTYGAVVATSQQIKKNMGL